MFETVVFYDEWLPLPKAEFNVLAMVAEQGGTYSGNLSDMCRYLTVTPQTRNREQLRSAIESLTSKGFLSCDSRGRTHHLKAIPKETKVRLPRRWVQSVIRHDYSSEKVAFVRSVTATIAQTAGIAIFKILAVFFFAASAAAFFAATIAAASAASCVSLASLSFTS